MEAFDGGEICIGNNLAVEQNVYIISGKKIDDITIFANVFISNVDYEDKGIEKSVIEQPLQFKETQIAKSCFIGSSALVLPGGRLENHCIVGANTVVRGSYPDNCVIVGNPT